MQRQHAGSLNARVASESHRRPPNEVLADIRGNALSATSDAQRKWAVGRLEGQRIVPGNRHHPRLKIMEAIGTCWKDAEGQVELGVRGDLQTTGGQLRDPRAER